MSIIEKAAAKLDSITSKENSSIIENAANKSADIGKITTPENKIARSQMPDTATKTGTKIKPKRLALNFEKLRHYGIITPEDKKTAITEQFRVIKRPLLTNSFNKGAGAIKNGNLIMVSSSLAGEGKSFCAVNLAMSIAMEMDHTVLLVDADVEQIRAYLMSYSMINLT
jgi:Mrp family chromosome partitioning ATPase